MRTLIALLLSTTVVCAVDIDGRSAQMTPEQRDFIKNLKSPNGVPCCDDTDGFLPPDWGFEDDHYWVMIEGERVPVPPEAVIVPNKLGEARVWVVPQHPLYIRCFLPGPAA